MAFNVVIFNSEVNHYLSFRCVRDSTTRKPAFTGTNLCYVITYLPQNLSISSRRMALLGDFSSDKHIA